MSKPILETMRRRGELLVRIAAQRECVAETVGAWRRPLALADRGWSVVRFLYARPALVVGIASLLALRRRGVGGVLLSGWRMWRLCKVAVSLLGRVNPRQQG